MDAKIATERLVEMGFEPVIAAMAAKQADGRKHIGLDSSDILM
jgi:hypothetical protein